MSSAPLRSESFHRLVHDLLSSWHMARRSVTSYEPVEQTKRLLSELLVQVELRLDKLDVLNGCDFEEEWSTYTWSLLSVLYRVEAAPSWLPDSLAFSARLNTALISLVNKARPLSCPSMINEGHPVYQNFYRGFASTLHNLHEFYSQLSDNGGDLDTRFRHFVHSQVAHLREKSDELKARLEDLSHFYSNLVYTVGILAARGFRYESQMSGALPMSQTGELLDSVCHFVESFISDSLFSVEPSSCAILVTNNLFPFQARSPSLSFTAQAISLARSFVFRQFHIQIVSEETAAIIQHVRHGNKAPNEELVVPAAALLAMKPTSGVKRNNATASAGLSSSILPHPSEGGNTAHKKSDVNSRESLLLASSYSPEVKSWQASYPHLLCTTRQKDTALLDSRSGQIGKRPLFYFHIYATFFAPTGGLAFARTLSLPVVISTRRNQDCQVQRMMSSYTATCFWLYGTSHLDGLMLIWSDTGVEWGRFKHLYDEHFRVNADVQRGFSEQHFELLQYKLQCEDCVSQDSDRSLITFKNVLCPHLKYDVDGQSVRFSLWRGMLEILQIFQDQRTLVRQLWNEGLLHGFVDAQKVEERLLSTPTSILCMRISFVVGGSVCFVVRSAFYPQVVHLEPLDLKKLQAKPLLDYLKDIARAEKVDYLWTATGDVISMADAFARLRTSDRVEMIPKSVSSNVTHVGGVEYSNVIRFTPMRIAVVTREDKKEDFQLEGNGDSHVAPLDGSLQLEGQPSMELFQTPADYAYHHY